MAALQLLQFDMTARIDELDTQLDACATVQGRQRAAVRDFLLQEGIYSIEDVTDEDIQDFREYINQKANFTDKQKVLYAGCMETLQYAYYAPQNEEFLKELEEGKKKTAAIKKAEVYLMAHGIKKAEDITYEIRASYEAYVSQSISGVKRFEYVKALDNMKLASIQKECDKAPFKERKLRYTGGKILLSRILSGTKPCHTPPN